MELMWWDLLTAVVKIICLGLMSVAAGLAFARYRRWSLGCLRLAPLLLLASNIIGLGSLILQVDPGIWLVEVCIFLTWLGWSFAAAGAIAEVAWLTRTRAKTTVPLKPDHDT